MTLIGDDEEAASQATRAELAERIVQLVHGATAPLRAWGRFFLEPEWQERDPELAAQAFSIYFVSLYDVCELARKDRLPKIADKARLAGSFEIALTAEIFTTKSDYAVQLLSRVPLDLQLTIRYFRDTVVHGPLGNYSNDDVQIKQVTNNELTGWPIPRIEFQSRVRECIQNFGSIGGALSAGAGIILKDSKWLDEIEPLICDPDQLYQALRKGCIPYPWKPTSPG